MSTNIFQFWILALYLLLAFFTQNTWDWYWGLPTQKDTITICNEYYNNNNNKIKLLLSYTCCTLKEKSLFIHGKRQEWRQFLAVLFVIIITLFNHCFYAENLLSNVKFCSVCIRYTINIESDRIIFDIKNLMFNIVFF